MKKFKNLKKNHTKFKSFELLRLKRNKIFTSMKFLFLKYYIFKKKLLLYKKSCFFFNKKTYLSSDINEICLSFGNSTNILTETIYLIEKYIIKFIIGIICHIYYISFWKITKRPCVSDLLFTFRKDTKKCKKIEYLLKMKNLLQKIIGSKKKNMFQFSKNVNQFFK
nr:TBP-assosiated factor 13 [Cryptomonas paramecium]